MLRASLSSLRASRTLASLSRDTVTEGRGAGEVLVVLKGRRGKGEEEKRTVVRRCWRCCMRASRQA